VAQPAVSSLKKECPWLHLPDAGSRQAGEKD